MAFNWNSLDTSVASSAQPSADIYSEVKPIEVKEEVGCPSYYAVYNPLCPSPSSEMRYKMMTKEFDRFIYLDNNATHPILPEVQDEMSKMMSMIGNGSSPHEAGVKVRAYIEEARTKVAKAIGLTDETDAKKIIFTGSGTESINTFIKGVFFKNTDKNRNIILTTPFEHKATLNSINWLVERFDVVVHFIQVDSLGRYVMNTKFIEDNKNKILLASVMAANNELGIICDYQSLCDYLKGLDPNIKFHVDMSQTLGKMKGVSIIPKDAFTRFDTNNYVDAATFTAHKFGGPTGISAFYLKDFDIVDPLLHGGNQEFQKRASTYNPIQICGMAKAIELIKDGDINKIQELRNYLEQQLKIYFNVTINCEDANRLVNTTSVTFKYDVTGEQIIEHLSTNGIFVSSTSACNSREKNPSYVLKSIGLSDDDAYRTMRISLSKLTTKEDLDIFITELRNYLSA